MTASLLVGRLEAAGAKLPLTRALREYGRLVETRFPLGYLTDGSERRAIGRQHNTAESLHAPHEWPFHGYHDTVRLHTLKRQSVQAHRLRLVANAVIYWNTIYPQLALDALAGDATADELADLTRRCSSTSTRSAPSPSTPTAPPGNSAPSCPTGRG